MLNPFDENFKGEKLILEKLDKKEWEPRIDGSFYYSLVWSLCCTTTADYRVSLNQKFKKILIGDVEKGVKLQNKKSSFPDWHSIYDWCFFPIENKWKQWNDLIEDKDSAIPKNIAPQDIIVTTIDKVRYQYILL